MSNIAEYAFQENLDMSQGVDKKIQNLLLEVIPGALGAHKAAMLNDRNGTDFWVEMPKGRHLSVDAKIRRVDYKKLKDEDDLALETWSVIESGVIGWTRDESKQTDYVLWYWEDTERHCLIPFRMLCAVFQMNWQQWCREYKEKVCKQKTTRANGNQYHSECVFVPRKEVWRSIYSMFS